MPCSVEEASAILEELAEAYKELIRDIKTIHANLQEQDARVEEEAKLLRLLGKARKYYIGRMGDLVVAAAGSFEEAALTEVLLYHYLRSMNELLAVEILARRLKRTPGVELEVCRLPYASIMPATIIRRRVV